MVAHFLHQNSRRCKGPFIALNCAALPSGLIESELFGHKKGAFTGAHADQPGKFRLADGGTLFLDEIGDMPMEVQTRLLRVLQEKTITPLGESREISVDFRLLCATHRDLRHEIQKGRFREDLYYRLNVVQIDIPPLRDRREDIPTLIHHFLSQLMLPQEVESAAKSVPKGLLTYPFPGNIRELRNLVERYVVMRGLGWEWMDAVRAGGVSEILPAPQEIIPSSETGGVSIGLRNSRHSKADILQALSACGHHRAKASAMLGISRRALQYRLAKMGCLN